MTPDEFSEMTRAAAARVENLTAESIAEARALLEKARDTIVVKLAGTPTEFSEWYYYELLKDVNRVFAKLETRYDAHLGDALDRMAEAVEQAVDRPLRQAGLTVSLPAVSRQSVEFLSGFQPGVLITGLTNDAKQLVIQELQQALLGAKTPFEVQQGIAQLLGDQGRVAARAEIIWRTESGRVFNTLATARYKRVASLFPGRFVKTWLHSGSPHPRPGHVALDGTSVPADEPFLVGGYPADGPHDPNLPAEETINCGCTSILELQE